MSHHDLAPPAQTRQHWLLQALILAILLHLLVLLIPAQAPQKAKVASGGAIEMTLQQRQTPKAPPPEPNPPLMTKAASAEKPRYRAKPAPKKIVAASMVKTSAAPSNQKEVEIAGLDTALGTSRQGQPLLTHYADIKHLEAPQAEDGTIRSQSSDKNKAIFGLWERQIRQKVERIGQQNFPRDDNGRALFGLMQFRVILNADGSIAALSLTQASGNLKLDQDALQIIRLAAPFGPVPVELLDANRQIMLLRYYEFVDERHVRWKQ